MSEWNRTTREIQTNEIQPELADAIQDHLSRYNLGPIINNALMCVETINTKKKKGLFRSGNQSMVTCAVITPEWLVWAMCGDKSGSSALSLPLVDGTVEEYALSPQYKFVPDSGLEITGKLTGQTGMHGSTQTMAFLGLGEEPAAQNFKKITLERIAATRR